MKDIEFVDTDESNIKSGIITAYEALAQRSLAAGDPIRLFLESIAALIVQQRIIINHSAKMNMLAYATGDFLDHIGLLVGAKRIEATSAKATFSIALSDTIGSAVTVPAGTRVATNNQVVFALDTDVIIPAGNITAVVTGTCVTTGAAGNSYLPGQISMIVDPIGYVQSITNTTMSEGGSDIESDEAYRSRIQKAPESFSSAGPAGAYEYFAKTASSLITDVAVESPAPGEVNIYPLLNGGQLPGEEILSKISAVLGDDVRPLTDKVEIRSPVVSSYDVDVTYYIDNDDAADVVNIKTAVEEAVLSYIAWQKAKLGRDINPTELAYRIRAAGAKRAEITKPVFTRMSAFNVAVANEPQIRFGGMEDG